MYVPRTRLEEFSPFHRGLPMLFVHTPKCGGSFVGQAFHRHFRRCISVKHPRLFGHLTWLEYRQRFEEIGSSIQELRTFSVIRNPFAWHVSWFMYIRAPKGGKRSGYMLEHELFQKMSFVDYINWLEDPEAPRSSRYEMGRQISDWIIDETGDIAVDHVLRQESLEKDLVEMARHHCLRLRLPKGKVNVSNPNADYRKLYTDDAIEVITRRHARDIEMFGYSF